MIVHGRRSAMETKLLRISGDNSRSLTFDQVYKQYGPLMKKKAYGWKRYEFDEMFQLASIALWEAFCKYDIEMSDISFGAFASKFIDNKLLSYYGRESNRARKITIVSYNAPVSEDDAAELGDLIGEDDPDIAEMVDKIVINDLMARLPQRQRIEVQRILDGFRRKEIVEITSQSKPIVSKRIKASLRRLKKIYVREVEGL
jgi:RNA polymerase sigma factor (sigma-70 family)